MFKVFYCFVLVVSMLLFSVVSTLAARNPENKSVIPATCDIETVYDTVCSVGAVNNYISNSTVQPGGSQEFTILIGDDTLNEPSMDWEEQIIYSTFQYLSGFLLTVKSLLLLE